MPHAGDRTLCKNYPANVQPQTLTHFPGSKLLWAWIVLWMLTVSAQVLYVFQFQETNAYIGIEPMRELSKLAYWLLLGAWLLAAAAILPANVERPSDIFLGVYVVATALWSASYWPATRLIDEVGAASLASMLLFPPLFIVACRHFVGAIPFRRSAWPLRLSVHGLPWALLVLLLLAAWLGYRTGGSDAGFDFQDASTRRLAGRDSFGGDPLGAYMVQMCLNGVAPYLAYLAALNRSRVTGLVSLGFAVFGFWLLGLKSPILNVVLLYWLGWVVRRGSISNFNRWLVYSLIAVMAASLIELCIFGESLVAEFGIRRVTLVSSTIQVYFADALSRLDWGAWLFGGLHFEGFSSPEYYIGANYMGSDVTNANTNAFVHQAAVSGMVGYAVVVVLAALLLSLLDVAYVRWGRKDGFAIATMLGVLLVEQAFGTALVSSGLLLCTFLMALFSAERDPSVNGPVAVRARDMGGKLI